MDGLDFESDEKEKSLLMRSIARKVRQEANSMPFRDGSDFTADFVVGVMDQVWFGVSRTVLIVVHALRWAAL